MSAAKHTQWTYAWGGGHALIFAVGGGPTLAAVPYDRPEEIPQKEEIARLIAAAPELLEALCALVLNIDAGGATLGAIRDARLAIAKATVSNA